MRPELKPVIHELEDLHSEMVKLVRENLPLLAEVHPDNKGSASNLLHYVALRRHDLRGLQERLAALGLSSLGRTEAHVLNGVEVVRRVLSSLEQAKPMHAPAAESGCEWKNK